MDMKRFFLGLFILVQLAIMAFVVWLIFGNIVAAIFSIIVLGVWGRLNIMHGRLPIGGGFGCDHEWEYKGGINVPQCAHFGIWKD